LSGMWKGASGGSDSEKRTHIRREKGFKTGGQGGRKGTIQPLGGDPRVRGPARGVRQAERRGGGTTDGEKKRKAPKINSGKPRSKHHHKAHKSEGDIEKT